MTVSVIRNESAWRNALSCCAAYDFYHTWDFHVISKNNGEGSPILFAVGDDEGGILLPLLERTIPGTNWLDLTSVYGYPSPLTYGSSDSTAKILALWDELLQFLRESGYVSLFSRGHPMLTPTDLREKYFEPIGDIVYIDCSPSEEEQVKKYRRNHRQNIEKLRASGVKVVRGHDPVLLQKFHKIYEDTMKALGADDYYLFSDEYYSGLLSATDFNAEIWVAELSGEPIAAGFLIFCGDFVEYHLSGTSPDYYKLAPTKILMDEARRVTTIENKKYLVLGGGYQNKSDNLLNFKKGFSDAIAHFYVAKIILNEERYEQLRCGREGSFFPVYRTKEGSLLA